jgi:hypothetical protein
MKRNRSQGWTYAKLSGHKNESLVSEELGDGYYTLAGKVESIFGDKTTPKPDIYGVKRHSLKKSLSGQVHMNKVGRFLDGYTIMYGEIPSNVSKVFLLLFGGSDIIDEVLSCEDCIHQNPKVRATEVRRKTITTETLIKYNEDLSNEFKLWFKDNLHNITELVFKKGWSKNEGDWVDILWYVNKLGDNQVNEKFDINEIIEKSKGRDVIYGTKNGGTTIQLPFGHLQFHQGGLQFHHNYEKIKELISERK